MEIKGKLIAKDIKIAIIVAKFNSVITDKLLDGAISGLEDLGVDKNSVDIIKVPGAFEIPVVANKIAKKYSAVITLGAIIKGETDHYQYVCSSVASGITTAALNSNVPVIFGVLTTDTVEQAMNRAGLKSGNKGYECAFAAIEMINILNQI